MPTYNNGAGYFLYVNDISEVYAYQNVPQGSSMYFMNRNYPVFYIKSVDMFNRATVDSYDLVKQQVQQQTTQNNNADYVTKDELNAIVADAIKNALAEEEKLPVSKKGR